MQKMHAINAKCKKGGEERGIKQKITQNNKIKSKTKIVMLTCKNTFYNSNSILNLNILHTSDQGQDQKHLPLLST